MAPLVTIIALNHDQASFVPRCLESFRKQTYPNLEIIFVDNGSQDGAVDYVRSTYPDIQIISNPTNLFYSKAFNHAFRVSNSDYVMPINVDLMARSNFVEHMVNTLELGQNIGMVSGKLLKMDNKFVPLNPPVIDSTGIWFSRQLRHFDRGSLEVDHGQYNQLEYVFGPSGAAPLYRRDMLEDIAIDGEYFDEDFLIYREDVDLAWRAQIQGWKCLYTPNAIAYHIRRVRPTDKRQSISPLINMHSVKNRFLMRIKNQTFRNALNCFFPTLWRDLLIIGYVTLIEHSSWPAFLYIIKLFPRMVQKRHCIFQKRRVPEIEINQWFSDQPVSKPFIPVQNH